MPLNWIDVADIPINALLLLEREQISWLPGWLPENDLAIVFKHHPHIAWYFAHKNPTVKTWVEEVKNQAVNQFDPNFLMNAEKNVLNSMQDLVIYAWNPAIYENLPFLKWAEHNLLSIVEFYGKTVIDIGSGTGKQAFIALRGGAKTVFSVEPVENLRYYLTQKAKKQGYNNLYCINCTITAIPLPDETAHIVMQGHVYGDNPVAEITEMERVTKPGGIIIHIPGNHDQDNEAHQILVDHGYEWDRFEEPGDGSKRKYWKVKANHG